MIGGVARFGPVSGPQAPITPAKITTNGAYRKYRADQVSRITGEKGVTHWGIDLAGPVHTPVRAPDAGVIEYEWKNDDTRPWRGYGPIGCVVLGDDGIRHVVAHQRYQWAEEHDHWPRVGQRVVAGELLGVTSKLGGGHCHWECRTALEVDSGGVRADASNTMDPLVWLARRRGVWTGAGQELDLAALAVLGLVIL